MTDTITLPRATVQQALGAIDLYQRNEHCEDELLIAGHFLRTALAQQAEPVAWIAEVELSVFARTPKEKTTVEIWKKPVLDSDVAIYTTPPQQQAEPVGEVTAAVDGAFKCEFSKHLPVGTKLYTAPPQRKPLTDEEIDYWIGSNSTKKALARAIEAAHNIKEGT